MTTAMAQHLLLAADRYQLIRLRTMCEKRLCDSVDVETVATTLMLADKSNADNLRKVRHITSNSAVTLSAFCVVPGCY
jgi:speckle-type POZ protein